jgi:murein DD-endopeptidase MepM/ murein hydrolase activator NlpD
MDDLSYEARADSSTFFPRGLKNAVVHAGRLLGSTLAGIFFIGSPWVGAILWIAISADIRFPLFAFVGLVVGDGMATVLGARRSAGQDVAFRSNAALSAIAVAWLLTVSGYSTVLQLAIAAFVAGITSILTATILTAVRGSALPPMVWAFCLAVGVLFTLFPVWANGAAAALIKWPRPIDTFGWIESAIRSLGSLVFLPRPEVGLAVAAAILLWSRAMFIVGTVGWLSGVALALIFERLGLNYYWLLASHNYFLAGMLLGSVYFLPGRASLATAAVAGIAASAITAYFQYLQPASPWAFLPIPAALTTWIGIGALTFGEPLASIRRNLTPSVPPELGWWLAARWSAMFGDSEPLLIVPLAGPAYIAQSFDGDLSHQGRWRHAVDFQAPRGMHEAEANATLWEAPVYAPASGIVERCRSDVPDNPFGMSNFADSWGNYVVIRLDRGGWIMLAHLQQGSLAVADGSAVITGTYLGKVGNSGRSPFPHLHLQAQEGAVPGSATVPFRLADYLTAGDERGTLLRWNAAGVPDKDAVVMGARPNPAVHALLASFAPGLAIWQVQCEGNLPRDFRRYASGSLVRVRIHLDEAGRHLLDSPSGSSLVLSMDPDAWRIVEARNTRCPLLQLIALATPSVPYAATESMTWREPSPVPPRGVLGWAKFLAAPYLRDPFPYLDCTCLSVPTEANHELRIKVVPETAGGRMPLSVTCDLDRIRGPVKLEAKFASGMISLTLLSFEPRFPFRDAAN